MASLDLGGLKREAAERIRPFFNEILNQYNEKIHSIHVVGSAVTDDYVDKTSDINSIVVLKEMDLKFLEVLAPLGKKYGKSKVSAPLIMTPPYIERSLDVFPIEFLNFKLIHHTVYGDDILKDIEIKWRDLRHQCEREIKSKLIWLRQGYISAAGDRKVLTEGFVRGISGYIPLFRGIIFLHNQEPPIRQADVIHKLGEVTGVNTGVFMKVFNMKREKAKPSIEELNTIFEEYYSATERLGKIIDEITQ